MRGPGGTRGRLALTTLVVLSLVVLYAMPHATAASRPNEMAVDSRVIVGYMDDADLPRILKAVESGEGRVRHYDSVLRFVSIEGVGNAYDVRSFLSPVASLDYVESDTKSMRAFFSPNDPFYAVRQWAPQRIRAPEAWDIVMGNSSVTVAVLDTGVDYNHEDLSANIWNDSQGNHGYDFVNTDADPMDDQNMLMNPLSGMCESNDIYHGTHISGVIAGVINNGLGVAGLAQVKIMAVKVLDDCGQGYTDDIARGVRYAADNGARIVVLSLGGSNSAVIRNAITYAWGKDVVIVAASGNDGGPISYPAAYPTTIAVGSTDDTDSLSSFSNFGVMQELVAPGEDIHSTTRAQPLYKSLTGTSQSAPQVAGVAALVLSRNPSLTNIEVRAILNSTATDLGTTGWDTYYGHGLVNAYYAVLQALPGGLNATVIDVAPVEGFADDPVTLTAKLKRLNGVGVEGRTLSFKVDSVQVGLVMTDLNGEARQPYTLPSSWGMHVLRVSFAGDSAFAESSSEAVITVRYASGGNISGVVMASRTYERLAFASISVPDGQITLVANSRGEFFIDDVPPGTWLVIVQHVGYVPGAFNVTVNPGETTLVPMLLRSESAFPHAFEEFPLLALIVVLLLSLITATVFLLTYRSNQRRIKAMTGPPPPEVPQHVASWLLYVHGIDAARFVTVERMPVAEGHQITLMEKATGKILVVRIDKYGRPMHLYYTPSYL